MKSKAIPAHQMRSKLPFYEIKMTIVVKTTLIKLHLAKLLKNVPITLYTKYDQES